MTSGHTDQATTASTENTDGARPRTPREKAGLRRQILDAAQDLFLKQEPTEVSQEAIAEQAGVPYAELDELYPTRSDLVGDLAALLYLRGYPFEYGPERTGDLRWLLDAYLKQHHTPEARLLWKIGDEINREKPGDPDAAYWHLVGDIELRLVTAGIPGPRAHKRALVLTAALMLIANRIVNDLTTPEEISEFVDAACDIGLGSSGS